MKKLLGLLLLTLFFNSCATKKEIVYFYEGSETLNGQENLLNYEPTIQPNDVLKIKVSSSSISEEIVAPFQEKMPAQQAGGGQSPSVTGYLVGPGGWIQFPVLGTIHVGGLTRTEIQVKLSELIEEYVKDPIIDVRIINYSVTVLGEVRNPGRIQITDGRISMPELIAMAGDITYEGKRENIKIIREIDGVKQIGEIDMTSNDLFNSPFFYLKQNDIVYIEPTYRAVKSAGFFTSYQGIISVGTTIISLYLLINSLSL
jgi:polysaccharide biosynthesis/export protein